MAFPLSLLTIRSRDIDRAARFYQQLGINFERHQHGQGPHHYAAESDGVTSEIYPLAPDDSPTVSTRLGFRVGEMASTIARLLDAGGELVRPLGPSPWGARAVVRDPDGHKVELCAERFTVS